MARAPLGIQLVQSGIITNDDLAKALEYQKKRQKDGIFLKLGEALTELRLCTDEDIARAMSQNTGYDLISLNKNPVDMMAANLITPEMAQKYNAIPVSFSDGKLIVAMKNPNDLMAIDDLRIITGKDIRPIVVPDEELRVVIERFSNLSATVEEEDPESDQEIFSITDVVAEDKPAVLLASQIINSAIRSLASDIHIEPHEKSMRIRYRIDGVLHEIMQQPINMHASVTSRIKVTAAMDIAERRVPQDGRATVKVDGKVIDIRVASLPSAYGEKLTLRLLNRSTSVIKMTELGFPENQLERLMDTVWMPYGFLLVTGPTGSGKSTTLYAALTELNTPDKNVITLEDPIERKVDGLTQIQMNEKAGMTFASGLRAILRNDPDIIMVGEIRDPETAGIAVQAALTGHFVLSTLHTNDASSAITRLGEMGVESFLTASSLAGVVAQRLVRVLCPRCRQEYTIRREELLEIVPDFPVREGETEIKMYKSEGCLSCNNTGYKGRSGVYEFLTVDNDIRRLIIAGASNHEIKEKAIEHGMTTLRMDGFNKVRTGVTSLEELLRVVV